MIHYCPKCPVKKVLVWQPSKLRYYCPVCHRHYTLHEVAVIQGAKR